MKAKPQKEISGGYVDCVVSDATHVRLNCPGPYPLRIIPVITSGSRRGTPCWTWNGDTEKPTLKPSIRTRGEGGVCHSFVTDGKIKFLGDCSHDLAGQTLDLLEVD